MAMEPGPFATKRRVGCVMWLSIAALIVSSVSILLDVTQELAWNARVEQVQAPIAAPLAQVTADVVAQNVQTETSAPTMPVAVQISGPTFQNICDVNESNMTDPQIKAHADQFVGQRIEGWPMWVYDVTELSTGQYNLELAGVERGLFWTRDVVIENIEPALATSLNVEQQVTLSGRIDRVETTFEVVCNPMYVTDATITLADGSQMAAVAPAVVVNTPLPTDAPPTPTPLPTWTPVPPPMNTDVIVDNIRWRATGVQEIGTLLESDDEFTEDATTSGKFVRVTMDVVNRRTEPNNDYEPPDIVDGQGRRFEPYGERFYYIPNEQSCFTETFNPSLPHVCMEIYEVAADSAGTYKLIVNNFESFDAIEATIDLR